MGQVNIFKKVNIISFLLATLSADLEYVDCIPYTRVKYFLKSVPDMINAKV